MSLWKQRIAQVGEELERDLLKLESSSLDLEEFSIALSELESRYLAKKGMVNNIMGQLAQLAPDERPEFGRLVNELKARAGAALGSARDRNRRLSRADRLSKEKIDITLPGKGAHLGSAHPISAAISRGLAILREMGFSQQRAPEIDTEFYMFDALNFPKDHPARDMQDTFYLSDTHVLRSQTTNAQARLLQNYRAPLRACVAGKVHRNETVSARSLMTFHQIDVLVVDRDVQFGDLLSHLEVFFRRFWGREIDLRTRLSYFPFVQPGIEVDMRCLLCRGTGCPTCKQSGWVEVCGAGMVHPNVLEAGEVDSETWTGFAWGLGVERLVMLEHGIGDIRHLIQNDLRVLEQFESL